MDFVNHCRAPGLKDASAADGLGGWGCAFSSVRRAAAVWFLRLLQCLHDDRDCCARSDPLAIVIMGRRDQHSRRRVYTLAGVVGRLGTRPTLRDEVCSCAEYRQSGCSVANRGRGLRLCSLQHLWEFLAFCNLVLGVARLRLQLQHAATCSPPTLEPTVGHTTGINPSRLVPGAGMGTLTGPRELVHGERESFIGGYRWQA
jgi:hypothetical protein